MNHNFRKIKWDSCPWNGTPKGGLIEDPALKEAPCMKSLVLFDMDIRPVHNFISWTKVGKMVENSIRKPNQQYSTMNSCI